MRTKQNVEVQVQKNGKVEFRSEELQSLKNRFEEKNIFPFHETIKSVETGEVLDEFLWLHPSIAKKVDWKTASISEILELRACEDVRHRL